MEAQAQQPLNEAQLVDVQKKMALQGRMRAAMNWFYWIAGFSLINSGAYLFGAKFTFVVGLGVTQVVDGIIAGLIVELGDELGWLRVVGMVLNICVAGVFVIIGYAGRKRVRWPVIVGMVLYALDAVLLVVAQDFLGAVFHAWALFSIWTGLRAMQALKGTEKPAVPQVIGSL